MTLKEKIGDLLNAAQRELACQKAQGSPNPGAINISEREVQQRRAEHDVFRIKDDSPFTA